MARKGERYTQIPTLWHLGISEPFSVMRKRKGDRRWRKVSYASLTKSSAQRWMRLVQAGKAQRRRDVTLEAMIGFGVVGSKAALQAQIREAKKQC
jgi:hypothetical protein